LPPMLVGVGDWIDFISSDLKKKIVQDSQKFLILNEADLQCSISRHLREFHSVKYPDPSWHVHNEFRQTKRGSKGITYPDIQIFKNDDAKISMELKHYFGKTPNEEKLVEDVDKLSIRGSESNIEFSVLLFTCKISKVEHDTLIERLEESSRDLSEKNGHNPTILSINASEEEDLDFEWFEKYDRSIAKWGHYGE
jgi:hypothetical protein